MGEIQRPQEQLIDEVSVQKLTDNHETIQQLTSQLQRMQELMNSMNDSGDSQDVESNFCGRLCHVSSQPVMIPSSRSLLSRDKRLPLDTSNPSGLQENVFGNQFSSFDSPRDHPQRNQPDNVPRNREALPEAGRTKTIHTSEDRQNQGTVPMPTFATKPWTTSSTMPVELPQSHIVGQQKTANVGIAIRHIPQSTIVFGVENLIQKSSECLFLIFHWLLCCGSKKWRWLILWTR